jgi:hypothetical protein
MNVPPPASAPIWQKLLAGQVNCQFECLAVKVFLGSAKLQLARDNSPETHRRLAQELHNVFAKNATLASVQQDLAKLPG